MVPIALVTSASSAFRRMAWAGSASITEGNPRSIPCITPCTKSSGIGPAVGLPLSTHSPVSSMSMSMVNPPDYVDSFAVRRSSTDSRSPEQLFRAVFEGAPLAMR
jgi:hypothetical protein